VGLEPRVSPLRRTKAFATLSEARLAEGLLRLGMGRAASFSYTDALA